MAIYRFKVFLEDNEDVYRDIDIKAAQTFEDFHDTIQDAFKFDARHAASFFVSDDYWRKGQEITLRKEDLPLDEEEVRKQVDPKKLMKDVKIARYIDQPHQRFVYVFDPNVQWTFLIEMMKITEEASKTRYPHISRSVGAPPKQYKQVNVVEDPVLGAGLLEEEIDEEPEKEETFSVAAADEGIEDDDISALEGEEGEESAEEEDGGGEESGYADADED